FFLRRLCFGGFGCCLYHSPAKIGISYRTLHKSHIPIQSPHFFFLSSCKCRRNLFTLHFKVLFANTTPMKLLLTALTTLITLACFSQTDGNGNPVFNSIEAGADRLA